MEDSGGKLSQIVLNGPNWFQMVLNGHTISKKKVFCHGFHLGHI